MIPRLSIAAALLCAAAPAAAHEPARVAEGGVRKECTLQPSFMPAGKMALPVVRCVKVAPEICEQSKARPHAGRSAGRARLTTTPCHRIRMTDRWHGDDRFSVDVHVARPTSQPHAGRHVHRDRAGRHAFSAVGVGRSVGAYLLARPGPVAAFGNPEM